MPLNARIGLVVSKGPEEKAESTPESKPTKAKAKIGDTIKTEEDLVSWGSMNGITFNLINEVVSSGNSTEIGNFIILNSNYEEIYNKKNGTKDVEFNIGSTYVIKKYVTEPAPTASAETGEQQ